MLTSRELARTLSGGAFPPATKGGTSQDEGLRAKRGKAEVS
jgi:hypothetical protein